MGPIAVPTAARSAFRSVGRWRCNGMADVSRYRSDRTGLQVTIADTPGPIVHGYICLATEADSDDGLPHTLEHLVFMGSRKYPYKGLLDLVANRCLASGTNAWTAVDHTAYTLTTAGSRGFLLLLPIYLDHIFRPLLTDAQFATEVHHINGKGEDAGVVYCEMQERESDMNEMVDRIFMQNLYPGSGYAVETGGRLMNLRSSTTNEKVRFFHQAHYHPRNCEIIISGKVDHEHVFSALDEVENALLDSKLHETNFRRPWSNPVPPMPLKVENGSAVREFTMLCPSDDEKMGIVLVGWRGPTVKEYRSVVAMEVLLAYLSETAVSPLERDFVQLPEPYCSSVNATLDEHSETCIKFEFDGVKSQLLEKIRPRLIDTLRRIASEEEPIDTRRMDDLLRQSILRIASGMENSAHCIVSYQIIQNFIYGESAANGAERLDVISVYEKLRKEDQHFWLRLLREFISDDKPYVCIIGKPSRRIVKDLTQAEKKRVKEQRQQLGQSGLKECDAKLKDALKENEKNTPSADILNRCIVNTLDGIEFLPLRPSSNRNKDDDRNEKMSLAQVPFTTLLDDCEGTNFARINVQLDTSHVEDELKPLLLLWSSLLFESPVNRNGEVIPYNQVVTELQRDLVSYDVFGGVSGQFYRMIAIDINVDSDRFTGAVEWISRLLYDVKFDPERVRVIAQRLINSAAELKRDGDAVARFLIDHMCYKEKSQPLVYSVIRQERYLADILKAMDERSDTVLEQLCQLRDKITCPNRMIVHLACEVDKMKSVDASTVLAKNVIPDRFADNSRQRAQISGGFEPLYLKPVDCFGQGMIASVGSCESCHFYQYSPYPLNYLDADLPSFAVLMQYFSQAEGPLWREIRGNGLAYGATISASVDSGLMTFDLYRTSNPVSAYEKTQKLIGDFLNGDQFAVDEFEAAKRSLVYEIVKRESTIIRAANQSLLSYYRGVPHDYNRQLIERIWDVKFDQLREVGRKYLTVLFDWNKANTAITCHPSNIDDIVSGFKTLGRDLRVVTLEDAEFGIL